MVTLAGLESALDVVRCFLALSPDLEDGGSGDGEPAIDGSESML